MIGYNGWIVFFALVITRVEATVDVSTKPNATAYRGGDITLPCQFNGDATGVYWYKHHYTGAPDDQAEVVASIVAGASYEPDQRFSITPEHSMIISDVTIADETTYSCRVALTNDETGTSYTVLMVIGLANPLYPVVPGCKETEPGKCDYVFGDVNTEILTCRVDQVYPAVSLTWNTQTGDDLTGTTDPSTTGPDQKGLFNVTNLLTVSKTQIGENGEVFVCKAEGLSVNGTSSLVASIKLQSSSGLSGGATAGIVIVFLIIIPGIIAAGIVYYFWQRKKKRQEKADEEQPLSPLQSEFKELSQQLNDYRPGSFSQLEREEGQNWPKCTRLGVYGVTHAGKSSLVRSLIYSLTGKFSSVEVAKGHSLGGVTIIPKKFSLTDYITVVDNRGLKDLDVSCITDIMDQIQGKSKHLEGTVDFPILVFDGRQPINALDKFLPDFVKAVRHEFGSYPAIVFTHREGVRDNVETIKAQATGMGALDQKFYFVENFTEEPTEPSLERRLEFLKMVKSMLEFADENLVQRERKKRGGNGAANIVHSDGVTASGSKGFFSRFKTK